MLRSKSQETKLIPIKNIIISKRNRNKLEKGIEKKNYVDDVLIIPKKLLCGKEKEMTISLLCSGNNKFSLLLTQLILQRPEVNKVLEDEEEEEEGEGKDI